MDLDNDMDMEFYMPPLTTKELHLFYRMDRELFSFLIIRLRRDVTQSLLVMALWLWLENAGYPNVIPSLMPLPHTLIDALANEAVACLQCLQAEHPVAIPPGGGLPLTRKLMQKEISLRNFVLKRYTAIAGIKSVLNNTCARIFNDVLQTVLKSKNIMRAASTSSSSSSSSSSYSRLRALNMPLVLPGFPHPLFGTYDLSIRTETMNLSDKRIWGRQKRPSDDAADDDKSMFLTFSRGFPVSEMEVRYLFTALYGDCVQSLTMGGNVDVNHQHLFAIMILKKVGTVDLVLNGERVAKLQVNGKHIWARKYARRD